MSGMKHSIKAKRMARHHARMNKQSSLNLTSLMDIFTILVFFLMVNSSDVQVVKDTDTITMPESIANHAPKQDIFLVQVDASSIKANGEVVALTEEIRESKEEIIVALKDSFIAYDKVSEPLTKEEEVAGRPVIVQGDQKVPYILLRKIMATAADANFRDIALAVSQKPLKVSDVEGGE